MNDKTKIRNMFIKTGILFVSCFLSCFISHPVLANEFKIDYKVDYYLTEPELDSGTKVSFKVKITNQTIDSYIKKFSLLFPKSFQIGNIKAEDDFKVVDPVLSTDNNKQVITAEFSNPVTGLNEQNTLYVTFIQYDLFKVNGNVWEVILPTIDRSDTPGDYNITVHLPPGTKKQISISKPIPTHVTINEVIWNNPVNKTVYAVFGDSQNYQMDLRYHLSNPNLTRVYTDITFPPDTLYQKVYVETISPLPNITFSDEDGNFIGRYYLNPKEDKTIYFKGGVSVYSKPRTDIQEQIHSEFLNQKKYLLSGTNLWKIEALPPSADLDSIAKIYSFTKDTLQYNYKRIDTDITRLGSDVALQYPDQAVCTEYSDVFIALLREKGFYSREMQGYGFSNDPELRPLSVNSDILHSWPEYFDSEKKIWVSVDPTWEDTSGIDYFNSFDLNHIVFVIHGKKADYPYPAGSYKRSAEEKDINIAAVSTDFVENKKQVVTILPLHMPGSGKNTYTIRLNIQNKGNTFIRNYPLTLELKGVEVKNPTITIPLLVPFEKKELGYQYVAPSRIFGFKTGLTLKSQGDVVYKEDITIASSYTQMFIYGSGITALFITAFAAYKLNKR